MQVLDMLYLGQKCCDVCNPFILKPIRFSRAVVVGKGWQDSHGIHGTAMCLDMFGRCFCPNRNETGLANRLPGNNIEENAGFVGEVTRFDPSRVTWSPCLLANHGEITFFKNPPPIRSQIMMASMALP